MIVLILIIIVLPIVFWVIYYGKNKHKSEVKSIEHFDKTMTTFIEHFLTKNVENIDSFLVQKNFNNKDLASDIIKKIHDRNVILINNLMSKYPDDANIKLLNKRYSKKNLREVNPNNDHNSTSYTINKGKEYGICIRNKSEPEKFIPTNTIMYVNIHELAHLASESYGHNDEFKRNFKLLLDNANLLGLYSPENYGKKPVNYCGISINENILF